MANNEQRGCKARQELFLSASAREVLRAFSKNSPSHNLLESALQSLAQNPELGTRLLHPLGSARVLSAAPGLKIIYTQSRKGVYVSNVSLSSRLKRDKKELRLGGLLLAAGRAEHSGIPEALYPLKNRPSILSPLCSMLSTKLKSLVLVLGHEARSIRCAIEDSTYLKTCCSGPGCKDRLTCLYNEKYQGPMIGSVQLGLKVLDPGLDGIFLGLANRPLLRAETIEELGDAFKKERPLAVRPIFEGTAGHPVLLSSALIDSLLKLQKNKTTQDILRENSTEILDLPVKDPGVTLALRNIVPSN